jgi:hypothetical protein
VKFSDIISYLNKAASEEAGDEFETMAKRAVNLIYEELLSETDTDFERREYTFATVAGTSKYGMPLYVQQVLNIEDDANDRQLVLKTSQDFDRERAGSSSSGTPTEAYVFGYFGVQKQPASAGTVSVVSSSALDAGSNYKAVVHGMSSGVDLREEITFTGTTPATSTSSFDAVSNGIGIRRVVLQQSNDVTFVGTVTVKDTDSNILSVIPPYWGDSPSYQWWELYPNPDAAITYIVRTLAKKPPLINDDDWPELDSRFHDLLIYGSEAILLPLVGKGQAGQLAARKYEQRKEDFLGHREQKQVTSRKFKNVTNPYIPPSLYTRSKIPNASG